MVMSFDADSAGVRMVMKCCNAKISDSRRRPRIYKLLINPCENFGGEWQGLTKNIFYYLVV